MLQRKALQRCMQLSTRGLAAQRPGLPRAPSARCGCATVVVALATERDPRTENKGLDRDNALYVDSTCIDCDTCRWMDPATYGRINSMSAVVSQPETPATRRRALQALHACPTHSIHIKHSAEAGELMAAHEDFPLPTVCPDVYHCGYHSEASFGGTSWFVRREAGNIMMDSPRYHPGLAKKLEGLGGVRYIVLSHRDDVADHAKWAEHFPEAARIIHKLEANSYQGTDACEVQLTGDGPWQLPDGGDDVELLFTPGHTKGHIAMLYNAQRALFSGDHLAYSARIDRLSIFPRYNWDSVPKQLESVRHLLPYDWLHLFPGHGRQFHFADDQDRTEQIDHLLTEEGAAGIL